MEENNSILSDIDGLNEHNLGQDDSNNYEDIEETEALVALSNAENSEDSEFQHFRMFQDVLGFPDFFLDFRIDFNPL